MSAAPPDSPAADEALNGLFEAARRARTRAYAPYSRFHVGAAIRTADGSLHVGCNVENAAYPEGTCAEAGAIAAMVMAGHRTIAEVAVVGGPESGALVLCPPCGGCRQKLREFAGPDALIHMVDANGTITTLTREALLPHSFGPDHLGAETARGGTP